MTKSREQLLTMAIHRHPLGSLKGKGGLNIELGIQAQNMRKKGSKLSLKEGFEAHKKNLKMKAQSQKRGPWHLKHELRKKAHTRTQIKITLENGKLGILVWKLGQFLGLRKNLK